MCGIAGILSYKSAPSPELVDCMVDILRHRGPDDRGIFSDGPLCFGMRRLSIIDLNTGHQPIFNEDRSKCIVFNGEIYNSPELREQLLAKGHRFSTATDTETILHLYEEKGESCVDDLQGMFAFAIWDRPAQKLFIARDRFGIKPLFYFWDGSTFAFASEIKGVLCCPSVSWRLSPSAIDHYFTFLYFPDEHSPFSGVHKLRPGHTLTIQDRQFSTNRYYSLPSHTASPNKSLDEWIEMFFEVATKVIDAHMLSDVPLGAFLSGGIDSSLVVAIMSRLSAKPIETFSIGYDLEGASFDERLYAKQVADLFGAKHRELVVSSSLVRERLPEILEDIDEPFGDASIIPNYLLSEFARNYVKVAMSGLGGDEVCAGYERYLGASIADRYRTITTLISNPLTRPIIGLIPDSKSGAHFQERLKRFARHAALPPGDRYYEFIAKFNDEEKLLLFSDAFLSAFDLGASKRLYDSFWKTSESHSALRRILKVDLDLYLVDDLLALSDRCSMAHSLEMRVPLVDHQLVEFFWSLPDNLKLAGFSKKHLLKKAAEKLLPHEIIYRKKTGFSVPLTMWFRGSLKEYLHDNLSEASVKRQGFFRPQRVTELLNEHSSGMRNHDEKLFTLLSFSVWHDKFF